MNEAVVRFI